MLNELRLLIAIFQRMCLSPESSIEEGPWQDLMEEDIDPRNFAELLQGHRLETRFLYLMMETMPNWCSFLLRRHSPWYCRELVDLLFQSRDLAVERHAKHWNAIAELRRAGHFSVEDLIPVKGGTTYLLTQNQRHIRFSGDIDLFCRDVEKVVEVLQSLGFTQEIKDGYHLGRIVRDDVVVEVHKWFPVNSYPDNVEKAVEDNRDGLKITYQPFSHPGETQICYSDLLAHSVKKTVHDIDVLVPNVTFTVLILCAHLFRHHLDPPLRSWWPLLRLVELTEIYDLVRHPEFDVAVFTSLVARFQADDSVWFASTLIQALVGRSLWASVAEDIPYRLNHFAHPVSNLLEMRFPHKLAHLGGWGALTPVSQLLLPASPQATIEKLGVNPIQASTPKHENRYCLGNTNGSFPSIERYIVHSPSRNPGLPFSALTLSVVLHANSDLVFQLELRDLSKPIYHFNITYMLTNSTWQLIIHNGAILRNPYGAQVSVGENSLDVSIPIPEAKYGQFTSQESLLTVFLTIMGKDAETDDGDPLVIVPLCITAPNDQFERIPLFDK